jgi:hypothetical protein
MAPFRGGLPLSFASFVVEVPMPEVLKYRECMPYIIAARDAFAFPRGLPAVHNVSMP